MHAKIVHSIPHRTRLRVRTGFRSLDVLQRIEEAISHLPGVESVTVSTLTGSILVHHSFGRQYARTILDTVNLVLSSVPISLFEVKRRASELSLLCNIRRALNLLSLLFTVIKVPTALSFSVTALELLVDLLAARPALAY